MLRVAGGVGRLERAGSLVLSLGDRAQLRDRLGDLLASLGGSAREGREQSVADGRSRLFHQSRDVAVVILEGLFASAVDAAADEDDQQHEHDDDRAGGHQTTDQQCLIVGSGGSATAAS